jgi:hypothetical protein
MHRSAPCRFLPWQRLLAPVLVLGLAVAAAGGGPAAAAAGSAGVPPKTFDISYPQCGQPFPSGATHGIVGVNDGVIYSPNPCLGPGDGPSELWWADHTGHPEFYANTGDPGPAESTHWPAPGATIDGHRCSGGNTTACSWVYGYRAAVDSFRDAVAAERRLGATRPGAAAAGHPWWFDVEVVNSWETEESRYGDTAASKAHDTADLQGAVRALRDRGVGSIGFYSTGSQWRTVTGGTGKAFSRYPGWVAGFSSAAAAAAGCSASRSFTGGRVALTQYQYGNYDADHPCPG